MDKSKTTSLMAGWRQGTVSDGEILAHLAREHQCEALAEVAATYLETEREIGKAMDEMLGLAPIDLRKLI